jgi:GCK domain
MGRVSTLTGELTDDDCDASMVLKNADSSSHGNIENLAIDIPTRMSDMELQMDKDWKGEIPPGRVLRDGYPAHKVEFEAIPSEKQLVVAGIICNSLYVDKDGNCTFDRAIDMQQSGAPVPSDEEIENPRRKARRKKDDSKTGPADTEPASENECPVCRYMKGGACKKDFENWEECVESLGDSDDLTKCFDVSKSLKAFNRSGSSCILKLAMSHRTTCALNFFLFARIEVVLQRCIQGMISDS